MSTGAQRQQELNEMYRASVMENMAARAETRAARWRADPERWRDPVPETETDPAEPSTHESALGQLSWILPWTKDLPVSKVFLDRMWGVQQADEAPTRILVDRVMQDPDPANPTGLRVIWAEPELSMGEKLVAMMIAVSEELESLDPEETDEFGEPRFGQDANLPEEIRKMQLGIRNLQRQIVAAQEKASQLGL